MKTYNIYESTDTGVFVFFANGVDEAIHKHNFIEIVYVKSGAAIHYVDSKEYKMKRGDILFINYGCTHSFKIISGKDRYQYYNVMFKPEFAGKELINEKNAFKAFLLTSLEELSIEDFEISAFGHFNIYERKEIENILFNMYHESYDTPREYGTVLKGYMQVLFTKMLRKLTNVPQAEKQNENWDKVLDYIETNYNEKLSLQSLAQRCFYNPSYFSRTFKKKMGKTLIEYITELRLETAVQHLVKTEKSIQEICQLCGFSSKNMFYKNFEKVYGCTPAEYRKKVNMRDE